MIDGRLVRRARLAAVWRGSVGGFVVFAGVALKARRWRCSSSKALWRASRASFFFREIASPGNSKNGLVRGFVDLTVAERLRGDALAGSCVVRSANDLALLSCGLSTDLHITSSENIVDLAFLRRAFFADSSVALSGRFLSIRGREVFVGSSVAVSLSANMIDLDFLTCGVFSGSPIAFSCPDVVELTSSCDVAEASLATSVISAKIVVLALSMLSTNMEDLTFLSCGIFDGAAMMRAEANLAMFLLRLVLCS